jgi:hypothetical protein
MITYYLIQEVAPGTITSERVGRTYFGEQYRTEAEAQRRVEQYNRHCSCDGMRYIVLPHSDREPLPIDYFKPEPVRYETVLIG